MATVKMVEYDEAGPDVKAVYDDIMATRNTDTINNFWKTIAVHPPTLARTWRDLKEVMAPGALDPMVKEMIAVAVSTTNGCSYCVNSHTAKRHDQRNAGRVDGRGRHVQHYQQAGGGLSGRPGRFSTA